MMDELVTVDRSWVEFEAEITSEVDEIDEEALITDGVAEVHRGINFVPPDTAKKKRVRDLPNEDKENKQTVRRTFYTHRPIGT